MGVVSFRSLVMNHSVEKVKKTVCVCVCGDVTVWFDPVLETIGKLSVFKRTT